MLFSNASACFRFQRPQVFEEHHSHQLDVHIYVGRLYVDSHHDIPGNCNNYLFISYLHFVFNISLETIC